MFKKRQQKDENKDFIVKAVKKEVDDCFKSLWSDLEQHKRSTDRWIEHTNKRIEQWFKDNEERQKEFSSNIIAHNTLVERYLRLQYEVLKMNYDNPPPPTI